MDKCNQILHDHYAGEGFSIDHDIQYNDGCGVHFKSIRAFTSLPRRRVKTSHLFIETNHGKSKSDGLGGVVKSFASRAICGERRVIRNAEEFTVFFKETSVVKSAVESHHPMLNRSFFFVSSSEMEIYRKAFPSERYVYIHGTYPSAKWWPFLEIIARYITEMPLVAAHFVWWAPTRTV